MKKFIALGLFAGFGFSVSAQSLSPCVIASTGGFFTSPDASLSATAGEMAMVETFSSASNILTQGFQQPNDILFLGVSQLSSDNRDIFSAYPNPVSGQISFSLNSEKHGKIFFQLIDNTGQVIFSEGLEKSNNGIMQHQLNLENYPCGIYYLQLDFTSGENFHQTFAQKISVER